MESFLRRLPSTLGRALKAMMVGGRVRIPRKLMYNFAAQEFISPMRTVVDERWPFVLRSGRITQCLYSAEALSVMDACKQHPDVEFLMHSSNRKSKEFVESRHVRERTVIVDSDTFDFQHWGTQCREGNYTNLQFALPTPPTTALMEFALEAGSYVENNIGEVNVLLLQKDAEVLQSLTDELSVFVPGVERVCLSLGFIGLGGALHAKGIDFGSTRALSIARTLGGTLLRHSTVWPPPLSTGPQDQHRFGNLCQMAGVLNAPVWVPPSVCTDWEGFAHMAMVYGAPSLRVIPALTRPPPL